MRANKQDDAKYNHLSIVWVGTRDKNRERGWEDELVTEMPP